MSIPWRAALTEFVEEEDLDTIALALWKSRKSEKKYDDAYQRFKGVKDLNLPEY
tara:strand:+ start:2932 stop:3093 length:162 start_codon:yes stop_codon:yes gene_type:complete